MMERNDRVWAGLCDAVRSAGREIRAAKAVLPIDEVTLRCRVRIDGVPPAHDPVEVARELLVRLDAAVSSRDLDATSVLFVDDPSVTLIGSEAGETAVGSDALVQFFRRLYTRPITFRWEWPNPIEGRSHGEVVWFFADGEVVERTAGREHRTPYRFTGVAVPVDGSWRLALIHGAEPVPPK